MNETFRLEKTIIKAIDTGLTYAFPMRDEPGRPEIYQIQISIKGVGAGGRVNITSQNLMADPYVRTADAFITKEGLEEAGLIPDKVIIPANVFAPDASELLLELLATVGVYPTE
jgi:hypothetical protein